MPLCVTECNIAYSTEWISHIAIHYVVLDLPNVHQLEKKS